MTKYRLIHEIEDELKHTEAQVNTLRDHAAALDEEFRNHPDFARLQEMRYLQELMDMLGPVLGKTLVTDRLARRSGPLRDISVRFDDRMCLICVYFDGAAGGCAGFSVSVMRESNGLGSCGERLLHLPQEQDLAAARTVQDVWDLFLAANAEFNDKEIRALQALVFYLQGRQSRVSVTIGTILELMLENVIE